MFFCFFFASKKLRVDAFVESPQFILQVSTITTVNVRISSSKSEARLYESLSKICVKKKPKKLTVLTVCPQNLAIFF